jgi:hypothetical protein
LGSVFPGYRVVEEVESGPLGQLVVAASSDGSRYRVRLLRDSNLTQDPEAQGVVAKVEALDHTGVVQRIGLAPGKLAALAAPEGRPTLAEIYKAHVADGLPGVPLLDLLSILTCVARALDEAHRATRLHHLLLQPAAVVVENGSAAVTDFGWGELLRCRQSGCGWAEHWPYAAPEVRRGSPGPASDQYSLSLIFLEMIQAWKPPVGRKKSAPLLLAERLTDPVREVVRKAIDRNPTQRFDTCSGFVAALREAYFPGGAPQVVLHTLPPAVTVGLLTGLGSGSVAVSSPEAIVKAALRAASPADSPERIGLEPVQAGGGVWKCRFPVRLMAKMVELKVRVLCEWGRFDVEQTDRTTYVLRRVQQGGGFWTKKKSGVELVLRVPGKDQLVNGVGTVEAEARLLGAPGADVPTFGRDLPGLLREVRKQVQNVAERRQRPRVPTGLTMTLYPVGDGGEVYAPVASSGRDLSEGGFSCIAPAPVRAKAVYVEFGGGGELAGVAVLARVVRSEPATDGTTIVAGQFVDLE